MRATHVWEDDEETTRRFGPTAKRCSECGAVSRAGDTASGSVYLETGGILWQATKPTCGPMESVRQTAKRLGSGVRIRINQRSGGLKEIEAHAPMGYFWRAASSPVLVASSGKDFAYLCVDIIERMNEGLEEES